MRQLVVHIQVYRALLQLGCEWRMLSSYRIQCMWKPKPKTKEARGRSLGVVPKTPSGEAGAGDAVVRRDLDEKGAAGLGLGGIGAKARKEGCRVIAGLTLYKVREVSGRGVRFSAVFWFVCVFFVSVGVLCCVVLCFVFGLARPYVCVCCVLYLLFGVAVCYFLRVR